MPNREIYLDNNATTAPRTEVLEAVSEVMSLGALNPASSHSRGGVGRRLLEDARGRVAALVGSRPEDVIFTSGGTEANHMVLRMLLLPEFSSFRVITTAVEHPSVRSAALELAGLGRDVVVLGVDSSGQIDLDELRQEIRPGQTLLLLQWANNETGVLQPLAEAAEIARAQGAWIHSDAVQATGKVELDFIASSLDSMAVSGHKLHGPTGVGALILREGRKLPPVLPSGDQERGVRPGTHNLAGTVGFGAAAQARLDNWEEELGRMSAARGTLENMLLDSAVAEVAHGSPSPRLPNTSNLRFAEVEGDALVARLDLEGVLCSQSSACTSRRPEPSYVLRAMGLTEEESFRSIRFSTSAFSQDEEIARAVGVISAVHASLRAFHLNHVGA